MLARKFLHYQQDRPKITGDETEEELTGPPPRSLYLLAACMIKVGGLTLWDRAKYGMQGCSGSPALVLHGPQATWVVERHPQTAWVGVRHFQTGAVRTWVSDV